MTDEGLSDDEQTEIVNDIASRLDGGLDDDELDDAFEKLDAAHSAELSAAVRDYADNAVGDENWDSDE
ncbi:MAG: hypothetical protein ABUL47_05870 [Leifsonia sp.]